MITDSSVEIAAPASLVWDVFSDVVQRSPGGSTVARHDVVAQAGGHTLVRQQLDQRGAVGALVGRLMHGMTNRYLELEAQGLKARSEQRNRLDGPAS
jgi:hypothetical protein